MAQKEKKRTITLNDLFIIVKKNIILLASIVGVFIIFGLIMVLNVIKPTYRATTQVLVAVESATVENSVDSTSTLRITETIAGLAETRAILVPVAQMNGCTTDEEINNFVRMIKNKESETSSQTNYLVSISIVDTNGELAMKYVNEIALVLTDYVNNTASLSAYNATLTTVSPAASYSYCSPNKPLYMIFFFFIGCATAAAIVLIKEFASNKFRTKAEIEELGYQILGVHRYTKNAPQQDDELVEATVSKMETYNKVLSNIKYSNVDNPYKVIMVTSTGSKELKTNMVSNLAFTAVHNEKKVLVIDLDVRKPRLHKVYGVTRENGMTDYLDGSVKEEYEFIKHTIQGVDVISAGKHIDNPYVVFDSQKLKDFVEEMKNRYDYVFIDTPPVTICADGLAISKICDGVIYNVGMNYLKKSDIKEGLASLDNVGANIIGLNITRYRAVKGEKGYNYYHYYGEKETKEK